MHGFVQYIKRQSWLIVTLGILVLNSCAKSSIEGEGPEQFSQIDLYFPQPYASGLYHLFPTGVERHFKGEDTLRLPTDSIISVYLSHWDLFRNRIPIELSDENHQVFWIDSGCDLQFEDWWSIIPGGYPTGTNGKLITNSARVGKLTLVCLHKPNKAALGVADGDTTNAGGELDYIATFDVIVE